MTGTYVMLLEIAKKALVFEVFKTFIYPSGTWGKNEILQVIFHYLRSPLPPLPPISNLFK